jgi:hypothetical protein
MIIARVKIALEYVEPAVVRRLEVPFDIKLSDLHLVIQSAMPWWNYHLYEFRARNHRWGLPDPDFNWPGMPRVLPAKGTSLAGLIATTGAKTFTYVYDFGDDWSTRSRSRRPASRLPVPPTRGSLRPAAAAHLKTSAAPGAMPSIWRRCQTPTMSVMPKWSNGAAPTSIQMSLTSPASKKSWPNSPGAVTTQTRTQGRLTAVVSRRLPRGLRIESF